MSVVIVGGGVMGAAAAYFLSRSGVTGITLIESGELASGSSGKPLGGVRAQFSDPVNIELGRRSLEFFGRFPADIGFQQVGYLFALRTAEDVDRHRASVDLQNSLGVVSHLVDPAEATRLCPYLDGDALLAAVWSPASGFARPVASVRGLAAAASERGVRVRTGTRVVGIDAVRPGRARIRLDDGEELVADAVVCTAGAWSGEVGRMAGVDLPVTPKRREIAFTPPLPGVPSRLPFTIDYSTTAYFHGSEDGGLLLGWADPDQPDGFDRSVSQGWHGPLRAALRAFAPGLADVPISHGWAGLYELTPDCNALIGQTDEPGFRFLYATGFSGHGFLQGPAVGECVRDLYLGRPPVVDISSFDKDRFRQPISRTEIGII
jgi:sarcosine oxidase subunit beta